ncbi:MAG: head GIN domain-containing protein [Paludibacter sp.]|jgi:Putative auto-transporter adhesin, head GIN domain
MNSRKKIHLALVLLFTIVFSSCISDLFGITGKGSIVTQVRPLTSFQSVSLNNAAKVDIVKGDSFKVEVSDYENLVKYLSVKVSNHVLQISTDPVYTLLTNSQAKVTITMPDSLTSVTLMGSGDINLNSAFKDFQSAIILGSGNIKANQSLNIAKLNASIAGSGNITASGYVSVLTGTISGSGNLLLSNLYASSATCNISGSGNMNLAVSNQLKASITGSGNIIYSGTPTLDISITGSGKVIHN